MSETRATRARLCRTRAGERAFAMPVAMLACLIVLIAGMAYLELARNEAVVATEDVQGLKALAAAELGLERARTMSNSQKVPWTIMTYGGSVLDFNASNESPYNGNPVCELFSDVSAGDDDASYSVVIESINGFQPAAGLFRIHAVGSAGNRTRRITVDAQTLTYASFGWLTNRERNIYFASGDKVDGWVYTNDRLNIYGSPVFTGKVQSTASSVNYAHGGPPQDNPDFGEGLYLNSPTLDMASLISQGHIDAIRQKAMQADGIHLGSNSGRPYLVQFLGSGKVTIKKETKRGGWTTVVNNKNLSSLNGAIYIEEHVQVKGTVKGQVTLATPQGKDIDIIDNLIYSYPGNKKSVYKDSFDHTDPEFTDKLGLIAGRDVNVKKSWSNSWGDMYIMASILAVQGSFQNYHYTRHPAKTLHIYGGLAQDTRGPVGMVGGRGFAKDYKYDDRFFSSPPPYFPTAMYDYDVWNVSDWRLEQ